MKFKHIKNHELSVTGKKFRAFVSHTKISFKYFHSGQPWLGTDRDFEWQFCWIPDDIEFWQHALWVVKNPDLLSRFLYKGYVIYDGEIQDRIPF